MDSTSLNKNFAIVFDFDGTLCEVFQNFNLKNTVDILTDRMKKFDIEFSKDHDAFDVFDVIMKQTTDGSKIRQLAIEEANQVLCEAELSAMESFELINGVEELLAELAKKKIPVGIATNNAAGCVQVFFNQYLPEMDIPVAGREGTKTEFMKPHPYSIFEVLKKLNQLPENTIFVGDTVRDYDTAVRADCKFLGLAPNQKKQDILLKKLPPADVFTTLTDLSRFISDLKVKLTLRDGEVKPS